MRMAAIINQKGGVGKSTTASALAGALSRRGKRVLIIDLDAQGNLSYSMGSSPGGATAAELLDGSASLDDAIRSTVQGDLIASSPALANADRVMTDTGREYALKRALRGLSGYDWVIADTPPSLGVLTVNALTACGGVLIPARADIFSLQGIGQLYKTIEAVREYCNSSLRVLGIVLTCYSARAAISRDSAAMIEETAGKIGGRLYSARIRECAAVREAQTLRRSLFDHAPKSTAAADYMALAEELEEDEFNG